MLAHRREGIRIVPRGEQRHGFGPAYRRLLPRVEIGRTHVIAALRRLDLRLGEADFSAQRHVVRHAIGAAVECRGFDDDELLDLHVVRVRFHVVEADRRVRQHPAGERGRLVGEHLREVADASPLLQNTVVDATRLCVGLLRRDHPHARHGNLLLSRI